MRTHPLVLYVTRAKIRAVRVMKNECRNAGLRVHHKSLCQLNADIFGLKKFPNPRLILQRRAGGVAEAVAFALVTGLEPVDHGRLGGIGETPVLANPPVQPFGAGFGGLDGQRLQGVRFEVFALRFVFLSALTYPRARANDEEGDGIMNDPLTLTLSPGGARGRAWRHDEVGEAEAIGFALAVEMEGVEELPLTQLGG